MAETYKNNYLSLDEMTGNAQIILDTMLTFGWTKESICGMLGNMQSESTINPGIWESLDSSSTTNGFGLVQWTPNSKYITDWAIPRGYTTYDQYGRIAPQCERIKYELENNIQWIATSQYPMSFQEFVNSTNSPDYLALVFIANYERPFDPNQPIRGEQALYWYNNLTGGTSNTQLPKYLYLNGNQLIGENGKALFYKTASNLWISVKQATTGTTGWQWPTPTLTEENITSYFGWRTNPVTGQQQFHNGIDIAGPLDTICVATQSGEVTQAIQNDPTAGNFVRIRHNDQFESRYLHLNQLGVSQGDQVQAGDSIGFMGTTGSSTGVHLHFEIIQNSQPVDPLNYVQSNGTSPIIRSKMKLSNTNDYTK